MTAGRNSRRFEGSSGPTVGDIESLVPTRRLGPLLAGLVLQVRDCIAQLLELVLALCGPGFYWAEQFCVYQLPPIFKAELVIWAGQG